MKKKDKFRITLLVAQALIVNGINGQIWKCSEDSICPSSLHPDGTTIRGTVKGVAFKEISTESPEITTCEAPYGGYNPCSARPCYNGGTCTVLSSHIPTYRCQCDLGFDGTECNITVQVLIVNPQKTGILVANMSDFVFSTFVDFGSSVNIGRFLFDDRTDTLYWMNFVSKKWLPDYRMDIRMHIMGAANWTVISNSTEDSQRCFALNMKEQTLYWSISEPSAYRKLKVAEEGALVKPFSSSRGVIIRCVIDQRRRYLYSFLSFRGIDQYHLDDGTSTKIIDVFLFHIQGFSLDEEGERLFWTTSTVPEITWFDIKNREGPFTLIQLDRWDIKPGSIVFVAGWLVWFDLKQDRICAARAEVNADIKQCRPTSEESLSHYVTIERAKKLSL